MNKYDIWLRRLVCLNGLFLLLAMVAIFLPTAVMASVHKWLGLGEFPSASITIYLARSTSLLYAVHGFLTCFVAWKWSQYRELVPLLAGMHIAMGLSMVGIDVAAKMPLYWTLLEGGPIACFGVFLLWMYSKASRAKVSYSAGRGL